MFKLKFRKNHNNYILNEGYLNNSSLVEGGKGSKIIIKRNKYIDLGFAAGTLILGHNSKIYQNSIKSLIKNDISLLASPNSQAKEFSNTLKKIHPQFNKFIFCNSGTEAVIKSLRICKALTNKKIIIDVTGSWHGSADQLLFNADKKLKPKKLSDGLDDFHKKNIKYIPYQNIQISKKILDKYKKKINCIIIEPIQGCLPINAKKYLSFLVSYAKKNKIFLIFDEMITGLRINGNSAQAFLSLKTDLALFGKSFGGGLPIGIIAISSKVEKLMKRKKIFFGGTFSANSISSHIGNATTKYIFANRKKILKDIERKSIYFQNNISEFIMKKKIDAQIFRFQSIIRLVFTNKKIENRSQRDFLEQKNKNKIEKFRSHLFKNKIFYPSSGIIFFSYATTYKEINKIINVFKKGLVI